MFTKVEWKNNRIYLSMMQLLSFEQSEKILITQKAKENKKKIPLTHIRPSNKSKIKKKNPCQRPRPFPRKVGKENKILSVKVVGYPQRKGFFI